MADVPAHHAPLVQAAKDRLGSLEKLAAAITEQTHGEFAVTFSTVWKWLHGRRRVSMEHAWAIDLVTDGEITVYDFHPIHRKLYSRTKRPRNRVGPAVLAGHVRAAKSASEAAA